HAPLPFHPVSRAGAVQAGAAHRPDVAERRGGGQREAPHSTTPPARSGRGAGSGGPVPRPTALTTAHQVPPRGPQAYHPTPPTPPRSQTPKGSVAQKKSPLLPTVGGSKSP